MCCFICACAYRSGAVELGFEFDLLIISSTALRNDEVTLAHEYHPSDSELSFCLVSVQCVIEVSGWIWDRLGGRHYSPGSPN